LFDGPASALRPENGLEILDCDVDNDPALRLFAQVARGVSQLNPDRLLQTYGFCALPFPSYHITAFDVANVADLGRCRAEVRDALQLTFDVLPDPSAFDAEFLTSATSSELAVTEWNLAFGYKGLHRWGRVLAVELSPLDETAYRRFFDARASLSRSYLEGFGFGAKESFTPHISLGYFMNLEGAELATPRLAEWDKVLRETIGSTTITFPTVSLYGFTDMATFLRRQT
jgi:hypothetical protein